jgi:hypothetical protein
LVSVVAVAAAAVEPGEREDEEDFRSYWKCRLNVNLLKVCRCWDGRIFLLILRVCGRGQNGCLSQNVMPVHGGVGEERGCLGDNSL